MSVQRIETLYGDPDDCGRFLTAREADEVGTNADRSERLASKWCLKEAVLKTIGGLQQGLSLTEIETGHDAAGAPFVQVTGGVRAAAEARGIRAWLVSTSHNDGFAIAQAIALGSPAGAHAPETSPTT